MAGGPLPAAALLLLIGATAASAEIRPVRPGETLAVIAARTGVPAAAIAAANGLTAPYPLRTGQRLTIPEGQVHAVAPGETGLSLARRYGVPWARIIAANGLGEPFLLRTGQSLLIPAPPAGSIEARARAFRIDIGDLASGGEPALAKGGRPAVATPARPAPATAAVAPPAGFAGRFAWPLAGRILVPYGTATDGRRNDGVNIAAEAGDPVGAAADGTVAYAGTGIPLYGNLVLIRHGDGWLTAYGHLGTMRVARGQAVKRGQPIGTAGKTGFVAEPQLHFEIRQGRRPRDPMTLLPPR
ncbi:MAG: M23 family metallopeptidase [Sphingomonas fennica]